jgi:hypothetical protein
LLAFHFQQAIGGQHTTRVVAKAGFTEAMFQQLNLKLYGSF